MTMRLRYVHNIALTSKTSDSQLASMVSSSHSWKLCTGVQMLRMPMHDQHDARPGTACIFSCRAQCDGLCSP